MNLILIVIQAAVAPLLYFLVGYGLSRLLPMQRSPGPGPLLLGAWVSGFVGVLGLALGRSFHPVLGLLLVLGFVMVWRDRREMFQWKEEARNTGMIYGFALLALVLQPYPGFYGWGGDWLEAWETLTQGQALHLGLDLTKRTPLFALGARLLQDLSPGYSALEIYSAVCAAAAFRCAQSFWERRRQSSWQVRAWSLSVSGGAAFFLLNTTNCWAKFLTAGAILLALREERPALRWFWLMAAVATHQSAVLFVPLILLLRFPTLRMNLQLWIREAGWAGLWALLIPGIFEAWVILRYGLEVRLHSNPVVYYRTESPYVRVVLLNFISTLTGWWPWLIAQRMCEVGFDSARHVGLGLFWLGNRGVTAVAGTLLGVVLPWFALWPQRRLLRRWQRKNAAVIRPWFWGCFIAIVGQSLLSPYENGYGLLQNGCLPVALVVSAGLASLLSRKKWVGLQALAVVISWGSGLAICAVLGSVIGTLLALPGASGENFRQMVGGMDADYNAFQVYHLQSLSDALFPLGPILALGIVGLWGGLFWRLVRSVLFQQNPPV